MLAKRIIPSLLCRGRTLVKGKNFHAWRSVGVVEQAVRIHQARGVDELLLLDIGATKEGRGPDLALIEELTKDCFMPLTVGGGVRNVTDVRNLLLAGADKVVFGAVAYNDPYRVIETVDSVGSQAVVVAIDVAQMLHDEELRGPHIVWIENGTTATVTPPERYAKMVQTMGAGEILLTSITHEGEMMGYDLELIEDISKLVDIPVIAHGGCGTYEHMREALEAGASAVASGSMFLFSDSTPSGAAEYLHSQGIEVRLQEQA